MYRYPKTTLAGILFLQFYIFLGCRQEAAASIAPQLLVELDNSKVVILAEQAILHNDTVYQYSNKGEYTYNYDVIGADATREPITSNVNMHGKYGMTGQAGKKFKSHSNGIGVLDTLNFIT